MDLCIGRIRRNTPRVEWDGCIGVAHRIRLLVAGMFGRRVRGSLFLQKQFDAFDTRVGMEAPDHPFIEQVIAQGKQDHALMVRHERTDDGMRLAGLQAIGCEIHGFVKTIESPHLEVLEAREVLHHCLRRERQCQDGGVGGHDQIVRQAAFVSQAGNAKRLVLIDLDRIEIVVAGFGCSPGNTVSPCHIGSAVRLPRGSFDP